MNICSRPRLPTNHILQDVDLCAEKTSGRDMMKKLRQQGGGSISSEVEQGGDSCIQQRGKQQGDPRYQGESPLNLGVKLEGTNRVITQSEFTEVIPIQSGGRMEESRNGAGREGANGGGSSKGAGLAQEGGSSGGLEFF